MVGVQEGSATMQIFATYLRRNLPDWGSVRGIYFCIAADSSVSGSPYGNLRKPHSLCCDLEIVHFLLITIRYLFAIFDQKEEAPHGNIPIL